MGLVMGEFEVVGSLGRCGYCVIFFFVKFLWLCRLYFYLVFKGEMVFKGL